MSSRPPPAVQIEESRAEDREAIGRVTRESGVFTPEEEATVFELFDSYRDSPAEGYLFLSARSQDELVGFACWGETALTQGAFDLYWICTAPASRGRGVGRALFERVEAEVKAHAGRLILIWTSGTEAYFEACRFYERMGCILVSRIAHFYRPGDDLLVYVKYLDHPRAGAAAAPSS
jgi:ribosomal protein S18 acetylase RimI-like enzyme